MKQKISKIRNRVRNKYSSFVSCFTGKQGRPGGYQVTATNLATGSTCTTTSDGGKWRSIKELKKEKLTGKSWQDNG